MPPPVGSRKESVDLLLLPPASVSIYWRALIAAGRQGEVDAIQGIQHQAASAGIESLEQAGVWASTTEPAALRPYDYNETSMMCEIIDHGPARTGNGPDLHVHVVISTPARTSLDRPALERVFPFVHHRFGRSLLDGLSSELGLATREVNGASQLVGVPEDLIAAWEPIPCRRPDGVPQLR